MSDKDFPPNLEALLAEFARSGVRELHVRSGEFELFLSNDPRARAVVDRRREKPAAMPMSPVKGAATDPPPAAPAATSATTLPDDAIVVRAPNLGTFYRAPKPGTAFYVEVGSVIEAGAELCLIEVMKLFTAVRSEFGGRVHAVLAEDGSMVEAGQPLFAIVRDV